MPGMRAVVCPSDSFVGVAVCHELEARGYEVLKLCDAASTPEATPDAIPVSHLDASWSHLSSYLLLADLVACELRTHTHVGLRLLAHLASLPFRGSPRSFVAISDPLVWALTKQPQAHDAAAATPFSPQGKPADASTDPAVAESKPRSAPADGFREFSTGDSDALDITASFARDGGSAAVWEASDAHLRAPMPEVVPVRRAEACVLDRGVPGRLNTHVVCPGVLYGNGECEEGFHSWFHNSWQGDDHTALHVHGSGRNFVPTLHVQDLATCVASLASSKASLAYVLAADNAASTQLDLAKAISGCLGGGDVVCGDNSYLYVTQGVDRLILNFRFQRTEVPGWSLRYAAGLPACIEAARAQYVAARSLHPVRVVITGPPCSGKSELAGHIAAQYGLGVVSAPDIVAAQDRVDETTRAAVEAALKGKGGGRLPPNLMAALARALMASVPFRNRGFVLDGYPRTLREAQELFTDPRDWTEEETKLNAELHAAAAGAASGGGKGGKGGAKDSKGAAGGGIDRVADPRAVRSELLPQVLVLLDASEEEMKARCKGAEAAETSAAQQRAAALGEPAPKLPISHNNPADFTRRLNAYKALRAQDASDLEVQCDKAKLKWDLEQSKLAEQRRVAEEAAEYERRHRKRQRAPAGAPADQAQETTSIGDAEVTRIAVVEDGSGTVGIPATEASSGGANGDGEGPGLAGSNEPQPEEQPGPKLPGMAGYVGFFNDAGTSIVHLWASLEEKPAGDAPENKAPDPTPPAKGKAPAAVEDTSTRPSVPPEDAARKRFECLEQLARTLGNSIGPVRNYEGFKPQELQLPIDQDAVAAAQEQAHREQARKRQLLARATAVQDQESQLQTHLEAQEERELAAQAVVLRSQAMDTFMPFLCKVLLETVSSRPAHPIDFIANKLLEEANRQDANHVDPYDAPIYAERREKVAAKEARDATRRDAAQAKALREQRAREQADATLQTMLVSSVHKHQKMMRKGID